MKLTRRTLLKSGFAGAASALLPGKSFGFQAPAATSEPCAAPKLPPAFDKLKPLGSRVIPITSEEFWGRIVLAQRLMTDARPKFDGMYVTSGTGLYYYTGIRWWPSERLMALVVPRHGDAMMVCPAFEEGRLRQLLRWPVDVLTWQEDENPYERVVEALARRSIRTGRIAVEERTTFAFSDGLRKAARGFELASADPVTIGCRGIKTQHEMDLMRLSCEATFDVYGAVFASLTEGMTQLDIGRLISAGFERMGLAGDALVLTGKWAAQPHGTREPQKIREGEVILIDGGTQVEGYQSDVTRCTVLGKPPAKLTRAFEIVRQAQDAALLQAAPNRPCGSVDDAARKVITAAGFGPDYKYFTHRVGHGIGLDGHEWPYLVRGNKTLLQAGMTFSNEPGIYVPGDYGLRLEDDMFITEYGSAQLLTPGFSASIEDPMKLVPN